MYSPDEIAAQSYAVAAEIMHTSYAEVHRLRALALHDGFGAALEVAIAWGYAIRMAEEKRGAWSE